MKQIVFIVGRYFPNYSAVGRCQGNLADEMVKEGYQVTVIAQRTEAGEKSRDVYQGQNLIRVATKIQLLQLRSKELGDQVKLRFLRYRRICKAILSASSLRRDVVKTYVDALDMLPFVPDMIIPTCLPFESIIAALDYKKNHAECKVVPVLYDMFAQSRRLQYFDWNQRLKRKANMELEWRVLTESDQVLHMSSWTGYVEANYPDLQGKLKEIEHPLIVCPKSNCVMGYDRTKVNFVYTGVVDKEICSPSFAIGFLNHLSESLDILVHFYTLGSAEQMVEDASKAAACMIAHGQVDHQTAHSAMVSADFLVSIGNTVSNQFPSKVFDYMSTGKPILHFVQSPEDPVIEVLKKYPLSLCIDQTKGCSEEQIKIADDFIKQNKGKSVSFEQVCDLFKEASPTAITRILAKSAWGVKLLFAGALIKGYVEAVDVCRFMSETSLAKNLHIDFYSAGNGCLSDNEFPALDIHNHGWVSHPELEEALEKADILLNIAEKDGKQISSKLFEYMSYGKPIIHFYYKDADVNLRYLRNYPLALCICNAGLSDEDRAMAEKWILGVKNLRVPMEVVESVFKEMTPAYVVEEIMV